MAYQSTYYSKAFIFKEDDVAIDITGWEFRAQFRTQVSDTDDLLELTTDNSGFVTTDAGAGTVELRITATQLEDLPVGTLHFDVMRTDVTPGPVRLFGGKLRVKQPVTR